MYRELIDVLKGWFPPLLPVFPCQSLNLNPDAPLAKTRAHTSRHVRHFIQGPGGERGAREIIAEYFEELQVKRTKGELPFPASRPPQILMRGKLKAHYSEHALTQSEPSIATTANVIIVKLRARKDVPKDCRVEEAPGGFWRECCFGTIYRMRLIQSLC